MLKYREKVQPERISTEQYNREIDESIEQIEKGHVHTHQEVGEHIKQWGKR